MHLHITYISVKYINYTHLFSLTKDRFAKKQESLSLHNPRFHFYVFHFSFNIEKRITDPISSYLWESMPRSLIYYTYMMKLDKGLAENLITTMALQIKHIYTETYFLCV